MGNTDSKVNLRQSIFRLTKETINDDQSANFFHLFWSIPTSADELFTLLPAADVKRIRDDNPNGFVQLVHAVFQQLVLLANDSSWSSPQSSIMLYSSPSSLPTTTTAGGLSDPNSSHYALNCIRLLTRLIPFIFEASASPVSQLLENPVSPDLGLNTPGSARSTRNSSESATPTTLGQSLISTILQLLFRPGFTVPYHTSPSSSSNDLGTTNINIKLAWDVCHSVMPSGDWNRRASNPTSSANNLAQSSTSPKAPGNMIMNRIELLRLLLVSLSQSMYLPPPLISTSASLPSPPILQPHSPSSSNPSSPVIRPTSISSPLSPESNEISSNRILAYITKFNSENTDRLPTLWISLLIRSLIFSVSSWSPTSGWIPYDYLVLPANDAPLLAMLSAQILCTLIFSGSSSLHDSDSRVCHILAGLSSELADSLVRALIKLLSARRHSRLAGVLPGSSPTVVWFHEVLVLIFAFIHISQEFYRIADSQEISDLLIPEILGILTEYQNEQEINLLRITFQILISLSLKETSLAADIVKTIYALMSQPAGHLSMFYDSLLCILRKVIYYHQVDFASAEILIQLACVMGQPRYLVKGENNYMLALALFDMIEFCINLENRYILECIMKYHRQLSLFVFVRYEQLEPPLVGKGKAKKQTENWSPNEIWFQTWRSQVILPQLEHILSAMLEGLIDLDIILTNISRFPKDPPKSVSNSALDRYMPPLSVTVCLPGFIWGACYLRHKPGERSLGLWHGTMPKLFKVVHAPSTRRQSHAPSQASPFTSNISSAPTVLLDRPTHTSSSQSTLHEP